MIVYGSSLSPFVRKVLAFAAEKNIKVEAKPISKMQLQDPEFSQASPFRKMPALRDGDFTLSDSSAIVAYLEALHPEPNLIPTEPRARGKAIWYDEYADTILFPCFTKMFFNRLVAPRLMNIPGDAAIADEAEFEEMPPLIAYLDRIVPDSGFLVEDRLTLADLAVASPFGNLEHLGIPIDPSVFPRAAGYVAAILARPSFATWIAQEKALLAGLLSA